MPVRSVETARAPSKRARQALTRRRGGPKAAARRQAPRRTGSPRTGSRRPAASAAATTATSTLPPTIAGALDRLGRALAVGDLAGVSACFSYPSLFLTGADTHEFRDPLQVQTVFRETSRMGATSGEGAAETDKEGALVAVHVEAAADLGHGIFACDVRWPSTGERWHCIVQESAVGTALLRAAVVTAG